MTLQVYHLLPQSLNACINGINSRLNLLHEEGPSNLTKVVKNELHNKAHANKLLYAALHYRILSVEIVSIKFCSMSFITLPNNFKKCSLVEWPRWSPFIKSLRLL